MKYLSGWQALNVVNERGFTADWHPLSYFRNGNALEVFDTDIIKSPLNMLGITKRYIPNIESEFYIASFARAIADLVFLDRYYQLDNCVKDFLSDDDSIELYNYLKIINKYKDVELFMKIELTMLYFKEEKNTSISQRENGGTLLPYQEERIKVINDILPLLGNNFILKGGTCLSLFYNLNRYSENITLDSICNKMENIVEKIKPLEKKYKTWDIFIQKNTPTTFRLSIDYGGKRSNLIDGKNDYKLVLEANTKYADIIREGFFKYTIVNDINVYSLKTLCEQKLRAFSSREKIRDFYDIGFLLKTYPKYFSNHMLIDLITKIKELGIDELNLLLGDEVRKHNLVEPHTIKKLESYAEDILNTIEEIQRERTSEQY